MYTYLRLFNFDFIFAARKFQWDVRTGGMCQEYNYHLQPVNTILFFDQGRKFVTTSDDKKVLVSMRILVLGSCF
jgi:hypothetical protein